MPNAWTERFADVGPWKRRPLNQANIMTELREANCQSASGGAGADDTDIDTLMWHRRSRHESRAFESAAVPNQSGRCRESRR